MRHLDQSTPFDTATLVIHPENAASFAVAAKTGFVWSGELEGSQYLKRAVKDA
jgi:RimJ/RimL family protein N-acetyltransferase